MTKVPFRASTPQRTCTLTYSTYTKFKKHLARDFNNRCGYTDCHHKWFGGITTFHIDHFKPHKKFPLLKTDYSNLVYSCSYVNILKSDDDPHNYLDPCASDYNQHFYRDVDGTIYPDPASPQAVYMHKKLKLGFARYKVIWSLEKAYSLMQKLDELVTTLPHDSPEELAILRLHIELTREFRGYFDYLSS